MILDTLTSLDALGRMGASCPWYRTDAEDAIVSCVKAAGHDAPRAVIHHLCNQYRGAIAILAGAEALEHVTIRVVAQLGQRFEIGIESTTGPAVFREPPKQFTNLKTTETFEATDPLFERPRINGSVRFLPKTELKALDAAQQRALALLRSLLPFQAPRVAWHCGDDVEWTYVMDRAAHWTGE